MNLYAYVGNDPVNLIDPGGEADTVPEARYMSPDDQCDRACWERTAIVASFFIPGPEDLVLAAWGARSAVRYAFAARGAIKGAGKGSFKRWRRAVRGGNRNPNDIRFSQDTISSNFKDGRSVDGLIDDLKSGKISPDDLPEIRTVVIDGKLFTLDNRRLYAAQQAGVKVRTRPATKEEIELELPRKLSTFNDGKSVEVKR